MYPSINEEEVKAVYFCYHGKANKVLGIHQKTVKKQKKYVIRAFRPDAKEIYVVPKDNPKNKIKMKSIYYENFFELIVDTKLNYLLEVVPYKGKRFQVEDHYNFKPNISDLDLHLFSEGNHHNIYDKLGAHKATIDGIDGYYFTTWAPNAERVSVIGEFNNWDGRYHQMSSIKETGTWFIFIPGITEETLYKFEVKSNTGSLSQKSDPYGFYHEKPSDFASITYNIDNYEWNDSDWMEKRKTYNVAKTAMSTYEVHLGSWMRVPETNEYLSYQELAHKLVDYVVDMGYTHIELMPIAEHPFDGSWGYQVTGFYAPTSRFGNPDDFKYFVDHCHQNGIGVIIDWVPAHFPKDAHGLALFDGTPLYEHNDPRQGEHKDWGTLIFNYGRNEVRNFLVSNALFWLSKYHIDGLRVDAVASMLYLDYSREEGEWIPNCYGGRENLEAVYFIKQFNELCHHYFPGVLTIAEESTAWPGVSHPTYAGGLGFSLKWNMGWMNDFLSYMEKEPIHRKYHQNMITFALLYAFTENFALVLSHDEVVHGKKSILDKMPGNAEEKFANARLLHGFMYGHPGKKLLFQGAEFGQWAEWKESHSIDWHLLKYEPHQKLQRFVKDINHFYKNEPSLHQYDFNFEGFEWIDFHDADNSIISFIRKGENPDESLVFVFNFTPVLRKKYRVGFPQEGYYKEVINSDSEIYGGSNNGNGGGVMSENFEYQGRKYSAEVTVPPLGMLVFKPE